jgi:hypothetical protein
VDWFGSRGLSLLSVLEVAVLLPVEVIMLMLPIDTIPGLLPVSTIPTPLSRTTAQFLHCVLAAG